MLPVRTSTRPTVGQLARAQTFRFLTMLATWALIFAAFVYEPGWIRDSLDGVQPKWPVPKTLRKESQKTQHLRHATSPKSGVPNTVVFGTLLPTFAMKRGGLALASSHERSDDPHALSLLAAAPTAPPNSTTGFWYDSRCCRQSGGRGSCFDRFRHRVFLSIRRNRHLTLSEERSAGISDPPSGGRAQYHALAENVEAGSSGCHALGSIGPVRATGNQDCDVVA
jgi:hypothetical protein